MNNLNEFWRWRCGFVHWQWIMQCAPVRYSAFTWPRTQPRSVFDCNFIQMFEYLNEFNELTCRFGVNPSKMLLTLNAFTLIDPHCSFDAIAFSVQSHNFFGKCLSVSLFSFIFYLRFNYIFYFKINETTIKQRRNMFKLVPVHISRTHQSEWYSERKEIAK